ncbi:GNAT family N-acetyltransferase [Thomasclavelia cocleata]|uniref:GNAT family N-acetyltransferase n=1 Tax=Thomasclavelia cocleata TaxID=69824 RepID=UPI0024301150|nr:GNAT family N-acetyltransferase [Thomasclavelia cocleata]MCI9130840.1 GNAT family N-acetyltransferase [Thomasclavelia cocleata]
MNLEYCEAVPKDAKKIIDYLNKVAGESNNLTFGLEDCNLNEVEEMQLIKEIHEDPNSLMIVAKDGLKIVGVASLSGNKKRRLAHRAEIGVSVLKNYWHLGIGSNLVAILIGYAVESGIEVIDLEVVTSNEYAIALYEKYGFEIIATYKNFMKIDKEYVDAYLMNLYL